MSRSSRASTTIARRTELHQKRAGRSSSRSAAIPFMRSMSAVAVSPFARIISRRGSSCGGCCGCRVKTVFFPYVSRLSPSKKTCVDAGLWKSTRRRKIYYTHTYSTCKSARSGRTAARTEPCSGEAGIRKPVEFSGIYWDILLNCIDFPSEIGDTCLLAGVKNNSQRNYLILLNISGSGLD